MLRINTCFNDNILVRRSFPFHLGMRVEISWLAIQTDPFLMTTWQTWPSNLTSSMSTTPSMSMSPCFCCDFSEPTWRSWICFKASSVYVALTSPKIGSLSGVTWSTIDFFLTWAVSGTASPFVHKHLVNYNSLWQIIAHRIYDPERKSLPQAAYFGHKHTVGSHWINIQLILWSATTTDPTQSSTPWRWPWTPRRRWRRATDSRRCDPSTEPTLAILVADISR